MSLLTVIDNLYRTRRIHALDFHCPQSLNCDKEAIGHGMERQDVKASFIGSKYGSESLPRLVFVSLDPGNNDYLPPDPSSRTANAIQAFHEECEEGPKTLHWGATHLFALRLFNEIGHFIPVRDEIFAQTGGEYRLKGKATRRAIRQVLPYFCHVNSAKCGANADGKMTQAPGGFFLRCRDHAREELSLLSPDVVITQGRRAADLLHNISLGGMSAEPSSFSGEVSNERIRLLRQATDGQPGRKVLWLKTTHPRHGNFWQQGCTCGSKNCWCQFASAFARFVQLNGS